MENKAYLADNQDIGGDDHHEDDLPTYEQCMRKFNFFPRDFFVRIKASSRGYLQFFSLLKSGYPPFFS